MANPIRITIGPLVFEAELNDTPTAENIYRTLPIEAEVARWGDEIYFSISATEDAGDAKRDEMQVGELAFWPPGKAFCIFWGPTPASKGDEPRAASPVVPIGTLAGDFSRISETEDSQKVLIEAKG